jgi:hypothetical protein
MQASPSQFRHTLKAIALALALIAGAIVPPSTAGAQSLFEEAPYAELAGLQEAIQRSYTTSFTAELSMFADIARFDTEANAAAGLDALNTYYIEALATVESLPLAFAPVDGPALGAETRAYHATFEEGGNRHEAAFVQVLDGVYVYQVLALNSNDQDTAVAVDEVAIALLEYMIATPAGASTPEATGDNEVPSGTWEKLPESGRGQEEPVVGYAFIDSTDSEWFEIEIEIATPEVADTPYGFSEDLVALVEREYDDFDPNTGDPVEGGLGAYVQIAEVADPANAGSAFSSAKAYWVGELEAGGISLEPVETGIAADEVAAWEGQAEIEGQLLNVAIVLVRSGPYVFLVTADNAEAEPDPLAFASTLAQVIVDTEATSGPGEHDYDGASTGGIWDKLPATGDEVLGGLVAHWDDQYVP